jgi:hypothetical protein
MMPSTRGASVASASSSAAASARGDQRGVAEPPDHVLDQSTLHRIVVDDQDCLGHGGSGGCGLSECVNVTSPR